jgi:Pvc16 N-terminal domain
MIDKAITFIVQQLDDYIVRKTGHNMPHVRLVHMADTQDDSSPIDAGKLGCALVSMEEERTMKANRPTTRMDGQTTLLQNPEIRLNLFLLFAANPAGTGPDPAATYVEALKMLSHTVMFFQGKNEFTPENSPNMDPALKLLRMELYPVPIEDQSYLWGSISAAYLPSALYKVRLVCINAEMPIEMTPVITSTQVIHPS